MTRTRTTPEQPKVYAHYFVRLPDTCGELYVEVFDLTDDGHARVLSGASITGVDEIDGPFEFLALVRQRDLRPAVPTRRSMPMIQVPDRSDTTSHRRWA